MPMRREVWAGPEMPMRNELLRQPDEVKMEEEEEEEEAVDQAECRFGRRRKWPRRQKRRNNGDFDDGHAIGNGLEWMKQQERRGGHMKHWSWNDQQRQRRRRKR